MELLAQVLGSIGLVALAVKQSVPGLVACPLADAQIVGAFAVAVSVPLAASWRQAVRDGRLPALPTGLPRHNHISGWGFLALTFSIGVIVGIAAWAAPGADSGRAIDAAWGVAIVAGLAIFFAFPALASNVPQTPPVLLRLLRSVERIISPFGRILSVIDSVMVFAVSGSAGASRTKVGLRYLLLACTLIPCGVLGAQLDAPWGLAPLAWGFFVAISISRRWAWVEDDREVSMLNRRYTGGHLRIGFAQDLRDEALLSFMSMFILIPLALQQAQEWSVDLHAPLFQVSAGAELLDWISFYGTELAKAVPFVDWAEIYGIGAKDPRIAIQDSNNNARHVVFATRVMVDLVFLAALLQAIGISTRNARQKDLFFGEVQALDRLDPFIEPVEFRKLVNRGDDGQWVADQDAIAAFPHYDPIRLSELTATDQRNYMQAAAMALSTQQGGANSAEFHDALLQRAMRPKPDKDAIMEVVLAIRAAGKERQLYELDQARMALNFKPRMIEARTQLMRLLVEAPDTTERTQALLGAIQLGPSRDSLGPVRAVAIAGLTNQANELGVVPSVKEAAEAADSTNAEKREARAILNRLDLS